MRKGSKEREKNQLRRALYAASPHAAPSTCKPAALLFSLYSNRGWFGAPHPVVHLVGCLNHIFRRPLERVRRKQLRREDLVVTQSLGVHEVANLQKSREKMRRGVYRNLPLDEYNTSLFLRITSGHASTLTKHRMDELRVLKTRNSALTSVRYTHRSRQQSAGSPPGVV